jgi:hypothetical protein
MAKAHLRAKFKAAKVNKILFSIFLNFLNYESFKIQETMFRWHGSEMFFISEIDLPKLALRLLDILP